MRQKIIAWFVGAIAVAATVGVLTNENIVAAAVDAGSPVAAVVDAGAKAVPTALPAVDVTDLNSIVGAASDAAHNGQWIWFASLLLMVITYLVNKVFNHSIPSKILPWLAIGLGIVTNFLLSLASGIGWIPAIGQGVTMGLAAAGGWSAIGKLVLPTPSK